MLPTGGMADLMFAEIQHGLAPYGLALERRLGFLLVMAVVVTIIIWWNQRASERLVSKPLH